MHSELVYLMRSSFVLFFDDFFLTFAVFIILALSILYQS